MQETTDHPVCWPFLPSFVAPTDLRLSSGIESNGRTRSPRLCRPPVPGASHQARHEAIHRSPSRLDELEGPARRPSPATRCVLYSRISSTPANIPSLAQSSTTTTSSPSTRNSSPSSWLRSEHSSATLRSRFARQRRAPSPASFATRSAPPSPT